MTWREAALCAQTDPELFFPEKGGAVGPARRICAECEVSAECLAEALGDIRLSGIWGGTTLDERKAMRRAARRRARGLAVAA